MQRWKSQHDQVPVAVTIGPNKMGVTYEVPGAGFVEVPYHSFEHNHKIYVMRQEQELDVATHALAQKIREIDPSIHDVRIEPETLRISCGTDELKTWKRGGKIDQAMVFTVGRLLDLEDINDLDVRYHQQTEQDAWRELDWQILLACITHRLPLPDFLKQTPAQY